MILNSAFVKIWREVFANTFDAVIGPLIVGVVSAIVCGIYVAGMIFLAWFISQNINITPFVDVLVAMVFFVASIGFGVFVVAVTIKALDRYTEEQQIIMRTLKGTRPKRLKDVDH